MPLHLRRTVPKRAASRKDKRWRFHDQFYFFCGPEVKKTKQIGKKKKNNVFSISKIEEQTHQQCHQSQFFFENTDIFSKSETQMTHRDWDRDDVSQFPDHFWNGEAIYQSNELFPQTSIFTLNNQKTQPRTKSTRPCVVFPNCSEGEAANNLPFKCQVEDFWMSKYTSMEASQFLSPKDCRH